MLRHRIAGNFAALMTTTVVERGAQAAAIMLIARQVGPTQFGSYTATFALVRILAVLFSLGLDSWLLRNGYREQDLRQLSIAGTSCLVLKLGLGALWVLVLSAIAWWAGSTIFPPLLVFLSALTVWLEEIAAAVWSSFKAALQNQAVVPLVAAGQLLMLGLIGLLALAAVQNVIFYLLVQVIATGVLALLALIWFMRRFGWKLQPDLLRPTLQETLVFGFSYGLAMIYGRADVALAAYFLGETAAGLYSPAISLTNTLVLAPFALHTVMVPVLSQLYTKQPAMLHASLAKLLWASLVLGVFSGVGLALVSHPLVAFIYGSAYRQSSDLLAILGAVLAARFLTSAAATGLVAIGWQQQRVKVQLAIAILNVGLNLWVIPRWGVVGAAIVFVVTEWVLVAGYFALLRLWRQSRAEQAWVAG